MIVRAKSVAARSWSCSKTPNAPVTPRLRPGYDVPAIGKKLESWANRRKNVVLVAEVAQLVAEVVGDRKDKSSRNKVDGHVQNF